MNKKLIASEIKKAKSVYREMQLLLYLYQKQKLIDRRFGFQRILNKSADLLSEMMVHKSRLVLKGVILDEEIVITIVGILFFNKVEKIPLTKEYLDFIHKEMILMPIIIIGYDCDEQYEQAKKVYEDGTTSIWENYTVREDKKHIGIRNYSFLFVKRFILPKELTKAIQKNYKKKKVSYILKQMGKPIRDEDAKQKIIKILKSDTIKTEGFIKNLKNA